MRTIRSLFMVIFTSFLILLTLTCNFSNAPLTIVQDNGILSLDRCASSNGDYTVGSQASFWVEDTWKAFNNIDDDDDGLVDFSDDDYNEGIYSIDAEVVNVTSDVVIFVDLSLAIPLYRSKIHSLAGRCSDIVTTIESKLAKIPDQYPDSCVIIIITDIRDEAYYHGGSGDLILGYFWPVHSTTPSSGIRQYSHASEIIYLDINPISTGDISLAAEILSHELQHLVQFSCHPDQDLWLDEGLSVQTEVLCGYNKQSEEYHESFSSQPFKSLIYFDRTLSSYGFSSLFVRYLIDHFGTDFLSHIYKDTDIGLLGIINALQNLGHPEITSSELFINFSIALWLQDPNNSWYNLSSSASLNFQSPELITTFPSEQFWTIPSWGFWVKYISPISEDKVLHISFDSLDPYDSLDNHALFYVTLVHKTTNQTLSVNHWLMDPVVGDNQFLFSFPKNSTQAFLLVTAFAGTTGGPLPTYSVPTNNGSLKLSTRENSESFSFPGYIARYTDPEEILVSSIRYYSISANEWTPDNTIIAKWRLLKDESTGMEATGITGNLGWSQSGWYVPLLSVDTLSRGKYYFEFEFFNGSKTHSFLSDLLDLSASNSNLDTLLPPLLFGGGILGFIGLAVFITKKYNMGQSSEVKSKTKKITTEEPMKLSKLKPLFLGEKKDIDKVKDDVFKKHRRK